jgi:LysM repeat protein
VHAAQPNPVASRIAQASMRLADLGAMRPVVRIPARAPHSGKTASSGVTFKHAKLPPVWLLANALILVAAIVTIFPRVFTADAAAGCSWHTVIPGDTLGNLGWVYHTNATALAQANHIQNPNLIYVGQRLCIPMVAGAHTATEPTVNAGAKPVPTGTAQGVQAFLAFAEPYARLAHNATGWPVSMILAQWGLEQAWRAPGYTGYNFGNVAALPGQPTVNGIDVPGSPAAFAYAKTPQDGLSYYIRVAHLSYYRAVASAAASGGPDAAARALGRSPWDAAHYTAIGSPGSSLVSLIHKYNLYTYDQ